MRYPLLIVVSGAACLAMFQACTYEQPTIQEIESSSSSGDASSSSSSGLSSSSSSNSSGGASSTSSASSSNGSSSGGASSTSSASSSGAPPGTGVIMCDGVSCKKLAAQICCTNQTDYYECLPPLDCTSGDQITVACDGPEDCLGGAICCGTWDGASKYTRVGCAATCDAPNFPICHLNAADPGCPGTMQCLAEVLLGPTYGYCQ
ncbi:MAG TPA: hypothetical protein PK156_31870 [Polyangium sp.]|nr:hypothetical protein [Polyangium sp.]